MFQNKLLILTTSRLIYNDVTTIKVILFILVVLILTFFFGYLGSKLFYFWLDCHLNNFKNNLWHPKWCCFHIFHLVGLNKAVYQKSAS
jgi:hypothetical protein